MEPPRLWVWGTPGAGVLLRGPQPCPGEQGCWWDGRWDDAPTFPPCFFSSLDLTQNLPQCEVAAGKRTLN